MSVFFSLPPDIISVFCRKSYKANGVIQGSLKVNLFYNIQCLLSLRSSRIYKHSLKLGRILVVHPLHHLPLLLQF
jgi:hypothetical protein